MGLRSRFLSLALVAVFALVIPAAAVATTGFGGDSATEPTSDDRSALELAAEDGPAVEVPPAEVEEDEKPWTTRYLVPITLLLGLVAILGSLAYYGFRIRGRYRVAD